jgi:hypothetical protein
MALKVLKGVWFLSMIVALGVLLYVYASLPQRVIIQDEIEGPISVSNETVFYLTMLLMVVTNVLVFVVSRVLNRDVPLRTWFYGLITTLNLFFVVGLIYVSLFNTQLREEGLGQIAIVIYGSIALMVLWALAWPIYLLLRRLSPKQLA